MKITKIELKSGQVIEVSDGVTVVVGPNNVGKSSLLREINQHLSMNPNSGATWAPDVVSGVTLDFDQSAEEFIEDLKSSYAFFPQGHRFGNDYHDVFRLRHNDQTLPVPSIQHAWDSQAGIGDLNSYFTLFLNADNRTQLLNNTNNYDTYAAFPQSPLQHMFQDPELEKQADELIYDAFRKHVVLNRHGGSSIQLHIGKLSEPDSLYPSEEFKEHLRSLSTVQLQGDGFRAFAGMALTIMTGQAPLILLDEPEAFLHPPQARRFGRFLAEQHARGVQVIVATHSADILSGVTSVASASDAVSVLRLTRDESKNSVAQLSPSAVKEIYTDPLTRYYNMLDGLFSNGVVLCEADSDCTFYSAVLDSAGPNITDNLDLHFTHCGGKGRLRKAVATFREIKVPVACIVDIDILDKSGEFDALVASAGGEPNDYASLRSSIVDELNAQTEGPMKADALRKISEQFEREPEERLLPRDADEVRKIVNVRSGWREFKKHGVETVSEGSSGPLSPEGVAAFNELDEKLRALGIFMVRVGELESFHPELQVSKSAWLSKALEARSYSDSPLALDMLKAAAAFINSNQAGVSSSFANQAEVGQLESV